MTVSQPETPASYCENCGTQLPVEATACPSCGFEVAPLRGQATSAAAQPTSPSTPGESSPIQRPAIPDTQVVLGKGEQVWRQYHVTDMPDYKLLGISLSRASGRGTLYVTDSRLLFVATMAHRRRPRRSMLVQETQIQHITGMSAYIARRFSLWAVILVALIGILGLSALAKGSVGTGLFLLVIAGVGVLLLAQGLAQRDTVGLRVHSGAAEAAPLGFGQLEDTPGLIRRLLGPFGHLMNSGSAYDMLIALPGPHAELIILELGALVADMQSQGSLAGTHWGVEGSGSSPAGVSH
jgi:hypothetical protein